MMLGLFLFSRIGVGTSDGLIALYMFVLGAGIGGVMQVLVIAVQSAVDYKDLGTATASTTFFRSIGGSFGTAVFGAIFANVLTGNLADRLHGARAPAGLGASVSPKALAHLPAAVHDAYIHAFADSLHTVFLVATPIGAVAFALSWLMPEIELRRTTGAVDPGETFAMPQDRTSLQEVERAVTVLAARENRRPMYERLATRAGVEVEPRGTWLLLRLHDHPWASPGALAERLGVDPERLGTQARRLAAAGLVQDGGETLALTPGGRAAVDRLVAARREGLAELLAGWSPEQHPELATRLQELARELLADDDTLLEEAEVAAATG
jgi:DNA-binding MarR family transcriptional regulator